MPFPFFLFFFVFPFPFVVSRFHCPFRLVFLFVVFRLFLVSPSSLFFSLPCSPWSRILLFCLGATSSLRCLRSCKSAYSPCVWSSSSFCDVAFNLFYFFSLPSLFFYFNLDVVCLVLSCSCGYYFKICCLRGFGFCCVCASH